MKVEVEYLEFMWPMRHFLITCGETGGLSNIVSVSFCLPLSKNPPLLGCALGQNSYSRKLIDSTGEFIVNVPPATMRKEIYFCGFHSGADIDKFKATGLTPLPGRKVKAPIIAECLAHMECQLRKKVKTGDKVLFIGEVVEAYAEEDMVNKKIKVEFASGDFPRKVYSLRFKSD
ncbi:MAG: flavin reductase family protein [Candidatus Aminicenantes bacterium]|jgi:flavin reductase (DIM6/NTAB) family NADH-FMN oxidoreductase RutF|nr:flavin reductase family protein [Candidatus Aminicenantes bacterium]